MDFAPPTPGESLWQLGVSLGGLIGVVIAMHFALALPYWWAHLVIVPLAMLGAGFVVRIFIIQHDCGHGSFFRSARANDFLGALCGVITFTPYANWKRQHAGHHAHWNNLDHRASGADIYSTCMTLAEYEALSPARRRLYRVVRHPIIYQILLPPLVFLVIYRLPFDTPASWRRERLSVHVTNGAILTALVGMGMALGFGAVLEIHLLIVAFAAIVGVFLFSIQHRFETTTWMRRETWTAVDASLQGSSFLKLPAILRWFTGSIGYHHIHHLNARVPNYRLAVVHDKIHDLVRIPTLTLGQAFANYRYALWDEDAQRMVGFPRPAPGA